MQLQVSSAKIRGTNKLCIIFVVLGGGPALLAIPDIEIPGILSMKHTTVEARRCMRGINEQNLRNKTCKGKKGEACIC